MTDAFNGLWLQHLKTGLPLRTCAFMLALERVTQVCLTRITNHESHGAWGVGRGACRRVAAESCTG